MFIHIILFLAAFAAIWLSARVIVATVSSFCHLLHLSAFATSFFILGLATSLPEVFISVSAAIDRKPEIFAGTLFGGTIVIFLFVIPLLAILGNGINTNHQMKPYTLVFSLGVIFLPFIFALDGGITRTEAIAMILSYLILFYLIEKRQGFFEKVEQGFANNKRRAELIDFGKIIAAAVVLYFAAQILVTQTVFFAGVFDITPFLISLLVLALGTDLPETSVAIVSALKKSKSIAMGDYLGSAAANTLILGVLTLINGNFRFVDRGFYLTFILFLTGLTLFWTFARSKNNLSRREGLILLLLYAGFIFLKIFA